MNPIQRCACVALCLVLALLPYAEVRPQTPSTRAIWIWERPSHAMLESPHVAEEALSFLHRRQIRTLYLYADAFDGRNLIEEQPQLYRDFIQRAHAKDLQVYALLGSWYLHTERYVLPEHHDDAKAMLRRVLDYNASAPAAARFDGINYDIEPHLLDAWADESRARLLGDFLDMSEALMVAKRASGQNLPVGPAMPFWWDGIELEWHGVRKPVAEHVIDITDYVALMDYRNRAEGRDSILSHAQDELAYADKVGKRVLIGLEFNPSKPEKLSFHGMAPAAFEGEVSKVEAALKGRPAFAGFVFHHYLGYRRFVGDEPPDL